ncbi:uncharacterized protein LOC111701230 [Eurytemora carolleeae]|uniref:uncharacterized protein LOC111701230 n=1 Tax=Eurytemora carolleeae TaxID=1294199 RepID=UPI000C77962D|nr:uncharacterized protein LOC111701230 [Eurytemora carolleeae]|eukprot:XP_023328186.1 uncharacterized protein LOC111701230 [Eurytemora affinis]
MDGRRLARQLRVFNTTYLNQGGEEGSKVASSTDGEIINLQGINDYSGQILKEERTEFDSSGVLGLLRICSSHHGGHLDNPGLVTKAVGNVLEKWEKVWREKEGELVSKMRIEETPGAVYGDLSPCLKPTPVPGYINLSSSLKPTPVPGYINLSPCLKPTPVPGYINLSSSLKPTPVPGYINLSPCLKPTPVPGYIHLSPCLKPTPVPGYINLSSCLKPTPVPGYIHLSSCLKPTPVPGYNHLSSCLKPTPVPGYIHLSPCLKPTPVPGYIHLSPCLKPTPVPGFIHLSPCLKPTPVLGYFHLSPCLKPTPVPGYIHLSSCLKPTSVPGYIHLSPCMKPTPVPGYIYLSPCLKPTPVPGYIHLSPCLKPTPVLGYIHLSPCLKLTPVLEDGCFDNQAFFDTIEESADKLWIHLNELAGKVIQLGEGKYMMAVLGGISLTSQTYSKWIEFTDAFAQQVLEYHSSLVATVVLQDPESQDWTGSRHYMDGERTSKCIQYWWYYMQGLRTDVFNYLSPKIGIKIFGSVLSDCLSILAVRYSQAKPTLQRVSQYRADIIAILLCTSDLLFSSVENLHEVLYPTVSCKISRSIHAKCQILAWNLVLVGCPLKTLHRVSTLIQPKKGSLTPLAKPREETLIQWLHIINPGIFSNPPDKLELNTSVYLTVKMAGALPGPIWSYVVRSCLSNDFLLPIQIMKNFAAYIPGCKNEKPDHLMTDGCGNLLCSLNCYNSADYSWPQAVGSAVLFITMHGCPEKDCLKKVMEPVLRKLDESSFEILDQNMAWNAKKPVWFQAVADLLEVFFTPILEEVIEDAEAGRMNVSDSIKKISVQFLEVSAVIPPSFFQVCEVIEGLVPDSISPLCDSVVAHIMLSQMYTMINKVINPLVKGGIAREKLDFLMAVGEGLINMVPNNEIQRLEGLTDASANAKTDPSYQIDSGNEEMNVVVAELIASDLLADPHGGIALKTFHRFLAYNMEWIGQVLGVQLGGPTPENDVNTKTNFRITPWGYLVYRNKSCYDMIANIGGVLFEKTLSYPVDWESALRHVQEAPEPLVSLLLSRRAEFTEPMEVEESERKLLEEIVQMIKK